MDHSQPVQKDHYIITLLEVGFHPGFYHESFVVLCMVQSSRPAGGWGGPLAVLVTLLQSVFQCVTFSSGGKVRHPDVLWWYLISAIPLFLSVHNNSNSIVLPNTRATTWTLPKGAFCFLFG
uniref:Uncharacterized protein n=1 Tax=Rousettus aegyptiacus TaxID=9407 RepID=A0A7J8C2J0_ROUAE|nr:hypothetical protein HJG63_009384 [Rousettus aegyptiacus]